MSASASCAVIGAGAIGASWTALFLAAGYDVSVYDPQIDAAAERTGSEGFVRAYVANAWPALAELGMAERGAQDRVTFRRDPSEAVSGARFVQENAPEKLEAKHAVYAAIAPALDPQALVLSSTSGLRLSELRAGLGSAGDRLVIAHPFNPPHLIPLVELYADDATAAGALDRAEAFYKDCGKTTIRLQKEAVGHVANRLQAALWREAIHLVIEGVASVEDVDKAVSSGPGLRWAVLGQHQIFALGGGAGGMRAFCSHLGPAVETWWADLGAPELTPEIAARLSAGVDAAWAGRSVGEVAAERDRKLVALLKALRDGGG